MGQDGGRGFTVAVPKVKQDLTIPQNMPVFGRWEKTLPEEKNMQTSHKRGTAGYALIHLLKLNLCIW